ncbi:hypothetical protein B0H10DRAFT_1938169 [Mycena sp. CBHHK59/15]|nr:hypothetical protein B0H10DRAFT_1938169 [Mycena sp. CBHHK59/15]
MPSASLASMNRGDRSSPEAGHGLWWHRGTVSGVGRDSDLRTGIWCWLDPRLSPATLYLRTVGVETSMPWSFNFGLGCFLRAEYLGARVGIASPADPLAMTKLAPPAIHALLPGQTLIISSFWNPLLGTHGCRSQDGVLVIMFPSMAKITYSFSGGTVIIQPGIRLGDVASELYDKYGHAMAHGICSYVGYTLTLCSHFHVTQPESSLGGHAGFGGWGLSSRSWGLLIDQIVAADIVLANGTVVHASCSENPNFWSADKFAQLLRAYQTWGLTAPKEMGIVANIWQAGRDVEMAGYYMGSQADFDREHDWITVLTEADGGPSLSTQGAPNIHDTLFAKSLLVPTSAPLTSDTFSALAKYFMTTLLPDSLSWFIQFELWGGGDSAISSVPAATTAFPRRMHSRARAHADSATSYCPSSARGDIVYGCSPWGRRLRSWTSTLCRADA